MTCRNIQLHNGWLHLPIGRAAPRHYVRFDVDGQPFAEFYLGLSDCPDFYSGMDLSQYNGCTVTLTADDDAPQTLLDGILEGEAMEAGHPLYAGLYQETLRPQYHFSSRRDWLNDPNGLYYDGSSYHLYYQHNPYGIVHGGVNVHWGHAVSADGVRWEERSDAIRPWDCCRHIASGSCIIDRNGVAGYGAGTVIAAFTHLGSRDFHVTPPGEYPSEGQFLAYSKDGGNTFTLFDDNPVIAADGGKSWRDPRIFADPDGGFGIAVYETNEGENCVSFYHSDDLHHWVRTSRAENLYECPDLFRLTPVDGGTPKWVLYGADGMYRVGEFVNGAFYQEGQRLPMDLGKCTYAGQTWNNRDDSDGRMHIGWLRDESLSWDDCESYPGMPFSQCMTVACLLTLVRTEAGYRLNRYPVPAVSELRIGSGEHIAMNARGLAVVQPHLCGDMVVDICADQPFQVRVGNASFVYDPATGEVCFDGERRYTLQKKGALQLRVLTDKMSCEFFLQREISASYGMDMDGKSIEISTQGAMDVNGQRWEMRSIWL